MKKIIGLFKTTLNLLGSKFFATDDRTRANMQGYRVITGAFLLSLSFNFILVLFIAILLPLKEKVPYFVHFLPKEEQIVYVEPYRASKKSRRTIKEFMSRDYVKKRETIDLASENQRWENVIFLSNTEMKKTFIDLYMDSPESPYKKAVDHSYVRTVRIISSSVLNDDQYQVEYEYIDSKKATGKILKTTVAIATVSFEKNTNTFKGQDYLNNPFGYLVADYSIGIKIQRINQKLKPIKLRKKGSKNA